MPLKYKDQITFPVDSPQDALDFAQTLTHAVEPIVRQRARALNVSGSKALVILSTQEYEVESGTVQIDSNALEVAFAETREARLEPARIWIGYYPAPGSAELIISWFPNMGTVDVDVATLDETWGRKVLAAAVASNRVPFDFDSSEAQAPVQTRRRSDSTDASVVVEAAQNLVPTVRGRLVESSANDLFKVFLGHGGDDQWRVLRDALRDGHGFEVEAYEAQVRTGQVIRDVVEGMIATSHAAVLVLTRVDEMKDGSWRGRQNVVHEIGYAQARLGWDRVVVVVEEGVEIPSNLDGTMQVRYRRGQISSIEGQVAAALRHIRGDSR